MPYRLKKTTEVAQKLSDEFFTRYGMCKRLHSDQGKEFDSLVITQLCKMWGIKKSRSTPFAPWSSGQVERSNRSIKQMLRQLCNDRAETWDEHLPYIRFAMNHTMHSSTRQLPHTLFMTRCYPSRLPCDLVYGSCKREQHGESNSCLTQYVHEQMIRSAYVTEMARRHLKKRILYRKVCRDRCGLKIRHYHRGDLVWRLWLSNLDNKLSGKPWTGPYKVLDVDSSEHIVKLRIPRPGGGMLEKWIHVSNLKPVQTTEKGKLL